MIDYFSIVADLDAIGKHDDSKPDILTDDKHYVKLTR